MTISATRTSPAPTTIGERSDSAKTRTAGRIYTLCFPERPATPGLSPIDDVVERLARRFELGTELAKARNELAPLASSPLAAMRLSCGLSQRELALRVSTNQGYISQLEQGERDPGTAMIQRLADALGQVPERVFNAIVEARRTSGERQNA